MTNNQSVSSVFRQAVIEKDQHLFEYTKQRSEQ